MNNRTVKLSGDSFNQIGEVNIAYGNKRVPPSSENDEPSPKTSLVYTFDGRTQLELVEDEFTEKIGKTDVKVDSGYRKVIVHPPHESREDLAEYAEEIAEMIVGNQGHLYQIDQALLDGGEDYTNPRTEEEIERDQKLVGNMIASLAE